MFRRKRLSKSVLPTILCLVTAILVTACGGTPSTGTGPQTKAPASQQVYRWAFRLPDINSFDPGITPDAPSTQAINLVFTGLVQLNDQLQVQPQLAQSYDISSDGLTYTFHLRPNLKFSDGTPLTSADVAYSIDRALSPTVNNVSGVALTYLGLIVGAPDRVSGKANSVIGTGVTTPDPNTVVIKISKAAGYFLQALTYPTSFVVEKSVVEKWGLNKWTDHLSDNGGQGGDGPFKVQTYSHSDGITFVPNPNYYGPKPQLAKLIYQPYKDVNTEFNSYLAGQNDVTDVPPAEYQNAKNRAGEFSSTPELAMFYVGMNALDKPLDNTNIRQALSIALNRDVINKAAFNGAYLPSCHIIPKGMYGYDPNLTCTDGTTTTGNEAKAKQLFQQGLQEEGLTLATFPQISITYPSQSPTTAAEVTTMLQMWKRVLGITTIIPSIKSQNEIFNLVPQTTGHAGPLQMFLSGWLADYPDPQDWITLQFGIGSPNNNANFGSNSDPTTATQQHQLQLAMANADSLPVGTDQQRTARAAAYNQIEQQLVNNVAWMTIYQRPGLRLQRSYVIGRTFNAAQIVPPNDWGNIYIASH